MRTPIALACLIALSLPASAASPSSAPARQAPPAAAQPRAVTPPAARPANPPTTNAQRRTGEDRRGGFQPWHTSPTWHDTNRPWHCDQAPPTDDSCTEGD